MSKLGDRIKNADTDNIWKWGLMGLAAVATLIAGIFDTRVKDKKYERKLDAEIQAQTKRLMEENKAA